MRKNFESSERKEKLNLRPCVVVLSGTPLSGKTYLANELQKCLDIKVIDVDSVRHEIDETRRQDGQVKMLEPEQEKAIMIKSYTEMCRQAEEDALSGSPVLITGTFSRAEFKKPLEELAKSLEKNNIPLRTFLLSITDEEALKRIEKRKAEGSLSNIDSVEKFQWSKSIFSKFENIPFDKIDASTEKTIEDVLEKISELIIQ